MLKLGTCNIVDWDTNLILTWLSPEISIDAILVAKGGPAGHVYLKSEFQQFAQDAVDGKLEGQYIIYNEDRWRIECAKYQADPDGYLKAVARQDAALRKWDVEFEQIRRMAA